jgi:DNA-binding protein YbaB
MFGKMGDMLGKIKEAKKIADEIKTKLSNTVLNIESSGGDINVKISGNRIISEIAISPTLQHGDKKELEWHLITAMNKALLEVEKLNEEELKNAAGGLGLL